MVIYAVLVTIYLYLVVHYLGDWLVKLYHENLLLYALVALIFIVVQAVFLDSVTTFLMNRPRYLQEELGDVLPYLRRLYSSAVSSRCRLFWSASWVVFFGVGWWLHRCPGSLLDRYAAEHRRWYRPGAYDRQIDRRRTQDTAAWAMWISALGLVMVAGTVAGIEAGAQMIEAP